MPPEDLDLAGHLLREPLVVVIAEGDQVAAGRQHAGVARPGQPGVPPVADSAQAPPRSQLDGNVCRRALVEDHQALDLALVALVKDPLDGAPQQLGPVAGGDHHTDRRPGARGGRTGMHAGYHIVTHESPPAPAGWTGGTWGSTPRRQTSSGSRAGTARAGRATAARR